MTGRPIDRNLMDRSLIDRDFVNLETPRLILRKHRVYGSVDPGNTRSIALLERIGMRKEAHFRKSVLMNGEWADDVIYAVLDEEWGK